MLAEAMVFFLLGKDESHDQVFFFEILVLMELGSSVIFYGYSMDILSSTPTGWWLTYPSEKYASSSVGMIFHSQLNGKS